MHEDCMPIQKEKLIDLFMGSALGTFTGDAFGMPFEGWPSHEIRAALKQGSFMRGRFPGGTYTDDPDSVKEAAGLSSRITHVHPEGIAGGLAQALAVGRAVAHSLQDRTIDPPSFVEAIAEDISSISDEFSRRLRQLKTIATKGPDNLIDVLTQLYDCSVKAIEAVPPAIGSFLFTGSFRDTVVRGVSLG